MNTRERFLETMLNFSSDKATMKWEFGYWGETINKWYKEGLKENERPQLSDEITTPTASLYSTAWNSNNKYVDENELPSGIAVTGGGLYNPTQGFPLDNDVREYFNMDKSQKLLNLNLLFQPMFKPEVLEETEEELKYKDVDGVTRIYLKESATIPSGWEWPIKDKESWEKLKSERLSFENIRSRLPENWGEVVEEYNDRDYPLALGGYPQGYFGTLAHLMGYEELFISYYDNPDLLHDILKTFTDLWIAVYSEVLADIDVDLFHFWEDMSFGSGSMISKEHIREFMLPYYKKMTDFLKTNGVDLIFIDTDGDCMDIIPLFIEGGITGMYPFEVNCGMDIVKVREKYPDLVMMGGIPKSEIAKGKSKIDEILKPVKKVLESGGYIPFGDHLIPPEVDFENFKYYRRRLNDLIENS